METSREAMRRVSPEKAWRVQLSEKGRRCFLRSRARVWPCSALSFPLERCRQHESSMSAHALWKVWPFRFVGLNIVHMDIHRPSLTGFAAGYALDLPRRHQL